MTFDSKTILITGASQGLGRVLARHFAGLGAYVLLVARNRANLDETAALIEADGGRCAVYVADLARVETLERLAAGLDACDEAVDILINNAADVTSKPFLDTSLEEIERLVQTNVTGMLQLTRLLAPAMIERGGGVVVNVSSLAGYNANPAQTVYSITKGAVNAASEALDKELGRGGIRVMNVGLASVGDQPGQAPPDQFARALEGAILRRRHELFLSPVSKWLMRVYRTFPRLARGR